MPPTDRRAQILEAAREVFLERGVRTATVEEVTARAGVAKGTFYLYFESRDAVLEALRADLDAALLEGVETALKRKNRVQALASVVDAVVDFQVANRAAAEMISSHPDPGRGAPGAAVAALARFIAEGVRAGDFEARDPAALAALLLGGLLTALRERPAEEEALRAAASTLFRAALVRKGRKKKG